MNKAVCKETMELNPMCLFEKLSLVQSSGEFACWVGFMQAAVNTSLEL